MWFGAWYRQVSNKVTWLWFLPFVSDCWLLVRDPWRFLAACRVPEDLQGAGKMMIRVSI